MEPRMKLPEIRSAMYKVFTAGQLTEIEAETLDALINARAVVPPIEAPATRRVGSRPRPVHQWKDAAPGPPQADCRPLWQRSLPWPEQAVLAVVASEVKKNGACSLTIGHIAALAGVSETTVRNALRRAQTLALVAIEERRRTAWMNYPNKVSIVSKEWGMWLRLGTGANLRTPRIQNYKSGLALARENMNPRALEAPGGLFRRRQNPADPEEGLSA
jgi:hypothetical protein